MVLRLRGADGPRRGIRWAEDVVDNEGLGRKSSKVCCIYHAPKEVGESSSEDSSSDSDSDLDDTGEARMVGGKKGNRGKERGDGHGHYHEHGDECGGGDGGGKKAERKPSPNAYEKMPKNNAKHENGCGNVKR